MPRNPPSADGIVAAALLVVACFAVPQAARAQPSAAPLDGATYAGWTPGGSHLALIVERVPDGTVRAVLMEEPPGPGGRPGLERTLEAPERRQDGTLRVAGNAALRSGAGPAVSMELRLPLARDGSLDPQGTAEVQLPDAATTSAGGEGADRATWLPLRGVGTSFVSRSGTADGMLRVERRAPTFHAGPWRTLDLFGFARLEVDDAIRAGIQHLHREPDGGIGGWSDERIVRVQALTPRLVSVLVEVRLYTGGAHPNVHLAARTLLLDDEQEWRLASPCEALGSLGHGCDPAAMREAVIRDLARQGAAWVVDGSVDRDAPWLLDHTTITPRGVRVDLEPYAVGPYAQGPFTVHVPFQQLPRRRTRRRRRAGGRPLRASGPP